MKYAINYDDNIIIDICKSGNEHVYKEYDKAETLEQAREMIKYYWGNVKKDAESNERNAKNILPISL